MVEGVVRSDVSIAFDEICVVVVFSKNSVYKCFISLVKLSSESQTIESFRFEDENEDEDEDEALGFRHKEIFKLFRLQLGRDNVVAINFVVPVKLKTKKFEDFLVAKTECFVLVLVFVLVLESKAL